MRLEVELEQHSHEQCPTEERLRLGDRRDASLGGQRGIRCECAPWKGDKADKPPNQCVPQLETGCSSVVQALSRTY